MIYLDPAPLLAAARSGRPHHQGGWCPNCHGRSGSAPGTFSNGGGHHSGWTATCVTDNELANLLDTSIRQIQRWRHGVQIQARTADDLHRIDRMATAAGTHVLILWPELGATWAEAA